MTAGQVSWTNYRHDDVVHPGDITDATNGATEFIDVPLGQGAVPGSPAPPPSCFQPGSGRCATDHRGACRCRRHRCPQGVGCCDDRRNPRVAGGGVAVGGAQPRSTAG
ncbi:hypothetical protein F6X68_07420 [Micromonospora sp. AMSO12t]|nr:hypothetical protein F6X68_07420 [Micromonospora sp. AMSO12t]